jgi:transglutaminase-like putative cysteine protease
MDPERSSVEAKQNCICERVLQGICIMIVASGLFYYFYTPATDVPPQSPQDFAEEAHYPINKVIRYSFLVKNTSNQLIEQAQFKAYAPVQQTASQKVKSITASYDYTIDSDPLGNQVMNFMLLNLPPYGSKVITVTAEISLTDTPNTTNEHDLNDYLQHEQYIESNNPQIQALSERLSTEKQDVINQTVYNWVSQHISYAGYIRRDQGALYALKQGKGDCTEYMYLATALLRASDVPARGVAGFVVKENRVLNATDYHNWAEYNQDNSWHLLDAQKKVLDTQYQNYIAFRLFGKKGQNALSQSQRFLAYDSRLEVRMN